MVLPEIKRENEHQQGLARVLHSILFFASNEGRSLMPSVEEFVLSEVVNGTIAYVDGDAGRITEISHHLIPNSEKELWEYFQSEMDAHSKGKLNPQIRKSVYGLCKPYWVRNAPPDRGSYLDTKLHVHFNGEGYRFCETFSESSFRPRTRLIDHLKKSIIPSFSSVELKSIQGIGKAMRPFVKEDLDFIGKRFRW